MAKKAVKKEAATTSARNAKRVSEAKAVKKETAPVQSAERVSVTKAVRKETAPVQSAERVSVTKAVRKETAPVQSAERVSETKAVRKETAPVQSAERVSEAKPVEKETPATPARSARSGETKVEVYLQFGGREVKVDDIMEAAREDFCAREETGALQSVQLYLKPQDFAAYYVVNGAHSGKVAL